MHRKKQRSLLTEPSELTPFRGQSLPQPNFIPEYPISNKHSLSQYPDSLQRFQWELESSLRMQREMTADSLRNAKPKKKRVMTEMRYSSDEEEDQQALAHKKISKLKKEINQMKEEIGNFNKGSGIEDKLDRLLLEMVKSRESERSNYPREPPPQPPPYNIFYPPMPYPPQAQGHTQPQERPYDRTVSTRSPFQKPKPRNRSRRDLRKYFFVVAFTVFLRSQAKKLAALRKQTFRKFYLQKFDSQILNLKNWLVQAHGYALPVILEKQDVNFEFWKEKREIIQREKQNLVLKLIQLGLEKMKKDCTPQKISLFNEILQSLCGRGGFVMSRFWSAVEMESICISQFYGCIRANEDLQKFLIGMVVFVKVLIFNMFLQPHKFDNINFPKSKQQLTYNMYILASIYYRLTKQVLQGYLERKRPAYFKVGNWLNVKQEFIVECCQPITFNCDYPQEGEWIAGLLGNQLEILQMKNEWGTLKQKISQIIDSLHRQIVKRRKDVIRNQKYKLYH